MKVIFILLFVFNLNQVVAQRGFGDCIIGSLTNIDSTVGDTLYNARNWKDCVMNKPIPDFHFTTVGGKNIDTKSLKGKIVMFNFWFIECQPCIAELPALNKLVNDYKPKGVEFYAVTFQTAKSLKRDFFPKYKFDFDIVHDGTSITDMFAAGYPTTYIIDQHGIVKDVWNGGSTTVEAATAAYDRAKPVLDNLLSNTNTNQKNKETSKLATQKNAQ